MTERTNMKNALAAAGAVALVIGSPGQAAAHPHVFVEARSEVVFDAMKRITAVRHAWRFDEAFTAFAIQGLDEDGDGELSKEELAPLAEINVQSLKEYDYFTYFFRGDDALAFSDPQEYWLDFYDGRLTLFFTLPLAEPVISDGATLELEVYDPEYFVAYEMTADKPFAMVDAPGTCSLAFTPPPKLDAGAAAALSQLPATQREVPEEFQSLTETLSNTAKIACK